MMLTVLLGTIYPLLMDGLGLGKLSVGPPYFNTMFVYLATPFLLLMGLGLFVRWQEDKGWALLRSLSWVLIFSAVVPGCLLLRFTNTLQIMTYLGLALACWVLSTTLMVLWKRLNRVPRQSLSGAFLGMVLAHLGIAVTVIGIAISTGYGVENDVSMEPGDHLHLAGFRIHFVAETPIQGPNYHGTRAQFKIIHHKHNAIIYPEKRIYDIGKIPMTESAIDVSPFRDVYVALGEALQGHAWSVRVYYKPCVRWIWAGGVLMFLGGVFALADRRYYQVSA